MSTKPRGEAAAVHHLVLQRREETLHNGIVPAVAFAAHAASDPGLLEPGLVIGAGVLTPSVTDLSRAWWTPG